MLAFSVKKDAVVYLSKKYNSGVNRCCKVLNISRSSIYYTNKLDDAEIIAKLKEMVCKHPNRGFENYYHRIRREGHKWAWSRLLRVYQSMGLVRRQKRRRRLPEAMRKPLEQPKTLNEVWSMDFMSDSLEDGRTFRVLNIIDDCNRECLCTQGSISYPTLRVLRRLQELKEEVGTPSYIRTDNGPEFISKEYINWCEKHHIQRVYSEPGKPMQNGYIERFNRTFREDVLDAYLFRSLRQFNVLAEKWKEDHNQYHPHKSLKNRNPREHAQRRQPILGLSPKWAG